VLGLPDSVTALLFDLDGVLTQTAKVHAKAWKQAFDEFLRARAEKTGEPFKEFDEHDDYDKYVDGLPRYDGVRNFLKSRGIELPEGPYETVAGYVLAVLGHVPGDGEAVEAAGTTAARGTFRWPSARTIKLSPERSRDP